MVEPKKTHDEKKRDGAFFRNVADGFNSIDNFKTWVGLLKIFIPIWLAVLGIFLIYLTAHDNTTFAAVIVMIGAYLSVSPTKEVTIITALGLGVDPVMAALTLVFVDAVVSMFLIWNYDLVKKIPLLGPFLQKVERVGKRAVKKYAWIKQLEFFGIVGLILIPFQTLGGVICAFIGKTIGMDSLRLWLAIVIGTGISSFVISFYSEQIFLLLPASVQDFVPILSILLLIVMVIVVFILGSRNGDDENEKA